MFDRLHAALRARATTTLAVIATAGLLGTQSGCSRPNDETATAGQASPPAQTMSAPVAQLASAPTVRVFKDASCGCCKAWVEHMRQNGFQVSAIDEPPATLDSIKTSHGITQATASCHTAEVGNYVIEGHVPADLVQRLLREHPADVRGLTVPGMVTGSPGMEGPNPEHYTVVAMMKDGTTRAYAER